MEGYEGFRYRVNALIVEKTWDKQKIIHSHERTLNHQVTTFHGPPMETKPDWWRFSGLNPRIRAWKRFETDEVLGPNVQWVLPVSKNIQEQLIKLHPEINAKNLCVTYPGVDRSSDTRKKPTTPTELGQRFLFVGKEWKRKGLDFAAEIVQHYAVSIGRCTLDVFGPERSDLPKRLINHPNLNIKGWSDGVPWHKYDALIHPAKKEPFGMVIPEARNHGLPVLTATQVGSSELNFYGVVALNRSQGIDQWCQRLLQLTHDERAYKSEVKWTWRDLAIQHVQNIYPYISCQ